MGSQTKKKKAMGSPPQKKGPKNQKRAVSFFGSAGPVFIHEAFFPRTLYFSTFDRKMLLKHREKRDAAAIKAIDEALQKKNEETVETLTKFLGSWNTIGVRIHALHALALINHLLSMVPRSTWAVRHKNYNNNYVK